MGRRRYAPKTMYMPSFSPLHEGDTSVGRWACRRARRFPRFSPLHEGDTSVGRHAGDRCGESDGFQSPSRGGHLRGALKGCATPVCVAFRFQSPSRGGHLRGACQIYTDSQWLKMFQSPSRGGHLAIRSVMLRTLNEYVLLAPTAPSTLEVKAESPPLAPPAPELELQLPSPPAEAPAAGPERAAPAGPAAPRSTASGKIHMQCPHCGLVVRGFPEVFDHPIRCPDCNVESLFTSESQETAPQPAKASAVVPGVGSEEAAPAGPAAPSSTSSGKIHMQCPNCGLVVRGFPYVFAKPIRCPDCNVESLFKPEPQEAAPKSEDKSGSGWKKWGSSLLKRRGK